MAAAASAFAMSFTGCMSVSDDPPRPKPSGTAAGHHGSDAQPDGGSAEAPGTGPRRMGRSTGPMEDEDRSTPSGDEEPSADEKSTPGEPGGSRTPSGAGPGSESPTKSSAPRPAPPRPTGHPKPTPTPSRTTPAPSDPTPTPSQDPPPSSPAQTDPQSGSPASASDPGSDGAQ